jgi:hypothetical protein
MNEHPSSSAERLELRVQGVFDEDEARQLAEVLSRVAPRQRVRVHFHHVRHFHDHVVALLAHELAASYGRNIELVGLSQHQHRLFRYVTGTQH